MTLRTTCLFQRHQKLFILPVILSPIWWPTNSQAQSPATRIEWSQCSQLSDDNNARLACYDQWAAQQSQNTPPPVTESGAWHASPADSKDTARNPAYALGLEQPNDGLSSIDKANIAAQEGEAIVIANNDGCRNPAFDATSRFWELTNETDCGNFRFRGYKPATITIASANRVNSQPYSPSRGVASYQDYKDTETRFQISIRTKLASNLLTRNDSSKRDSLWFGYTQQSYWQLFNAGLSRPFRNSDYEPEIMYIYPVEWNIFGSRAKLRYAGIGFNHQSNGQSDPLSRSWNRYFITAGVDFNSRFRMSGKLWKRVSENENDDDNPNIGDYVGLAELTAYWTVSPKDTLTYTFKRSLKTKANGSNRLEWFHALGSGFAGGRSNLNFYASVFSGYGDSIIDYNFRRTVFNVGFSLLDF